MNRSLTLCLLLCYCTVLISCHTPARKTVTRILPFSEYISSYTSGLIGINEDIRINLNSTPNQASRDQIPSDLIQLDRGVSGKTVLSEGHILSFHPDKPLQSGQVYQVTFKLGKIATVPEILQQFEFQIKTMEADFSVSIDGIRSFMVNGSMKTEISGSVTTSDVFDEEKVERLITGNQNGSMLPVRWKYKANRIDHQFTIEQVKRSENPDKVLISWNGKSVKAEREGKQEIAIPASGDFSLLESKSFAGSAPYIELNFSDPLDPNQETEGLFSMQGIEFEVSVEDNKVRLIPRQEVTGKRDLEIFSGLKNYAGNRLGANKVVTLSLQSENPAIRFIGKGNIIPSTDGLVIPFESVNLSAVDIKIIKIFSNNYHQFFQSNNLDENNSLRNVGRPVYRGVLPLTGIHAGVLNKWSSYSFKINDLIKVEAGAIYQIELSMRPEYSLYPCSDDAKIKNIKRKDKVKDDKQWLSGSYTDEEEYQNEYEGEGYDWQSRNNPCTLFHKFYNIILYFI